VTFGRGRGRDNSHTTPSIGWIAVRSKRAAGAAASVIFSTAHHIGPSGEPYDPRVFPFRALTGMYFAMILQFRGFGIEVGTHACYDVLVGVAMA
jgi:hypothetical protein